MLILTSAVSSVPSTGHNLRVSPRYLTGRAAQKLNCILPGQSLEIGGILHSSPQQEAAILQVLLWYTLHTHMSYYYLSSIYIVYLHLQSRLHPSLPLSLARKQEVWTKVMCLSLWRTEIQALKPAADVAGWMRVEGNPRGLPRRQNSVSE